MRFAPLLLLPLIMGCATVPEPAPQPRVVRPPVAVPSTRPVSAPVTAFRRPEIEAAPGLEAVIEQDATALQRLFGPPRLDVREGDMRKLQFGGTACVLDVFLYPLRTGAEPVATYVEARRGSDGAEVDRVACVQALQR